MHRTKHNFISYKFKHLFTYAYCNPFLLRRCTKTFPSSGDHRDVLSEEEISNDVI